MWLTNQAQLGNITQALYHAAIGQWVMALHPPKETPDLSFAFARLHHLLQRSSHPLVTRDNLNNCPLGLG